jgi:Holliday junction DNA helicase RuvA
MIGYLSGTVVSTNEKFMIIDTGGVGYKVFTTPNLLQQNAIGSAISLWIYTAVREDTLDLFGFDSESIQELFELLISISGIGPKSALGILSLADIGSLVYAIKNENISYLTQVSGIGKKMAEKIILELKDKIEKLSLRT